MAVRINRSLFSPRQRAPVSRLIPAVTASSPVWPTVSIVFLLVCSVLFPPIAMTVLNASLAGLALAVVIITNRPIDRSLLIVATAFVLIATIGLISGAGAETYIYFKDAWYVLNPLLVIATGYILYAVKPDLPRGLRAFVIGGFIVALWQLRPYAFVPEIILLPSDKIRGVVGTGFYAPVAALAILLIYIGRWRDGLKTPVWAAAAALFIIAAAVAGVFSRTALMVVLITMAAMAGGFAKREWIRIGLPLVVLVLLSYIMQLVIDVDSDRALKTFTGKLAHALTELTVSDYAGVRDVNISYRGHETGRALVQYVSGDVFSLLFGRGFGALVDLGIFLPIEVNEVGEVVSVRYITVLHNGYAYLLTKVGAVGVALYVFALIYLYLHSRTRAALPLADPASRPSRLLQAAVVTLAATTYIVGGVFNKLDMFPFMLLTGYLLAFQNGTYSARPPLAGMQGVGMV